ncbi:type II toxin-antitoxin system PemK/MazF family toxin [Belliella sp. R4-6]|uniref:Type II toxin-antitoxin system PemK/MazF family toxin n=1 Tax=Belliella alkalica TaxID=1730871 RepID=A0ABS9VEY7_9BACT|nr:type II toxin-antitoxin system PemK/MazF family toxin [Belliella alkalica]MCH7415004.1 type II toxin-antitoxin system PemK/MazF family toxin [Belliella alkalica]
MEGFIKGDIVVIPFPFSDLSNTKRRPALVLASTTQNDLILCQITSQFNFDTFSVEITEDQVIGGILAKKSYIRPNKLFTADQKLILYKIASVDKSTQKQVVDKVIKLISN